MPQNYRQNNPLYYNAFMNGLYDLESTKINMKAEESNDYMSNLNSNNKLKGSLLFSRNSLTLNIDSLIANSVSIQELLESAIFISYDYCPSCYKAKKLRKLSIEEILGGFKREKSTYFSICNICMNRIYPKLYILYDNQVNLEVVDSVNFLSPVVLLKEVDNLIKNNSDKYFFLSDYYKHKDHRQIFWNIAFYFQILNLPLFVLYVQRNENKIALTIDQLDLIRYSMTNKKGIMSNNSSRSNTLTSHDYISRKQSSASNDVSSVFSNPTIKSSNLVSYDKVLHNKMYKCF